MSTLQAPYQVTFADGPSGPFISLKAGRHFRLYPSGLHGDLSERWPVRIIDLLRLAQAVVVVDGLLRRNASSAGYRNPHLEIEVFDASFWNTPEVAGTLKTCLDFLSGGDDWQIRFVADRKARHHHQPEFTYPEPTTVFLYSGGLDSAAGLAARLREEPDRTYIPVIVRHQFLRDSLVRRQFDLLKRRYGVDPARFRPLMMAGFVRNRRLQCDTGMRTRETSHRCRCFLFAAIGSIVAAVEGSNSVEIYESGIGALNLPLRTGMAGWKTTRSTHPHFLRAMSRLVTLVIGRKITFELPFLDLTKASMVTGLKEDGLDDLALSTVSCILHPLRRGATQCGICPACVFRRYAMQSAGIHEPPQAYHHDLFGSMVAFNRVPERGQHVLQAFLWQVEKLADLDSEIMPQFFRDHFLDTKIVLEEDEVGQFVGLFRRYRREWLELAVRGQGSGSPWANWLSPRKAAV